MHFRRLTSAVPVLLAFNAGACASWDPDNQARERAVAVLDCTEVTMEKVADLRYRASGCGGRVEILCSAGHIEPVCLAVRPRDEEHVSGIADVGSGGEVAEVEAPEDGAPTGPEAEDEGPLPPDGPTGDSARGPAGDPTDSPTAEVEAQIRRGLDARRDDVLACTNRSATVVRVRYGVDGAVTLTLGGDLEGSPEEGCVRAALGDVRVGQGHAGVVMHLVRR
jgi:hypothetical protein